MQPAKRVAVNTGILYGRMAITIFISLYATRLVLAALGAEDYGIFNVVGGSIAMLTFLNIAMTSATQRFMSYAQGEGNKEKQKLIFNVAVLLHFFIGIAVVLILEGAGYFLFNGVLEIPEERLKVATTVFQLMLASTFFTIISVPYDAVINAHENMLFVAITGIIEAVLKLAIAIFITYTLYDKLLAYGALMVLLPIFILILKRIYCHIKYEEVQIKIKSYFDKTLFKEMTSFASWSLLSSTASIVAMQGITIILNSFFGVIVNAAQGVSNQITGQLMAFSTTMLKALNPVIVKSEGGKNRDHMLKASMTGNKISFFLLAFFSLPAIIEMPFILGIWLKDVPDFAVVFCRLNLIRLNISQLSATFPTAIGAIGRIKQSTKWESFIYISLLPITYVMFEMGASPETVYKNLILMVIALFFSRVYFLKQLGGLSVRFFLTNVVARCLGVFTIAFSIASVPTFFMDDSILRLLTVTALSLTSFLSAMFALGLTEDEKLMIKTVGKNLFQNLLNKLPFLKLKQAES